LQDWDREQASVGSEETVEGEGGYQAAMDSRSIGSAGDWK
jgi:hypothetical protein